MSDATTAEPTAADADGSTTDTTTDATGDGDARFTQADLDRVVRDRLARQKAQFGDYDDLKAKASRLAELEAANQTELEKAQNRVGELETQAQDASRRAQEALLRSAVVSEAARKNVADPDDAVALIDRAALEFGDDGAPTNIGAAIDALLEAKPYLAGKRAAQGSADLGARGTSTTPGQLSRDDLKTMTSAEIVKAQADGRLDQLLRGD